MPKAKTMKRSRSGHRDRTRTVRYGRMLTLVVALLPALLKAQPGALDATFGTGGVVVSQVAPGGSGGMDVVVQDDGKVVVAGWARLVNTPSCSVSRFLSDGTPDPDFGVDGTVITDAVPGSELLEAVAIAPDGKIVVGGIVLGVLDMVVMRHLANGMPDTTFGSGGVVALDLFNNVDRVRDLVVRPDGRILLAGVVAMSGSPEFGMVQLNVDGSLDQSFGTNGVVSTYFPTTSEAWALALMPDGRFVAAGRSAPQGEGDVAVARYLPDGSLDPSFDGDGMVVIDLGTWDDRAMGVEVLSDGRIVISANKEFEQAVLRLLPDGTADSTFAGDGMATIYLGSGPDRVKGLLVQPDGKVVALSRGGSGGSVGLARFLTNGMLDMDFGLGGTIATNLGPGIALPEAMALQPDGKLLVTGEAEGDLFVARFLTELASGLSEAG